VAGAKAPAYAAVEEPDPLGLESAYEAAEEFQAKILQLADAGEQDPVGRTAHPSPQVRCGGLRTAFVDSALAAA
jgi:hypothetical protein